MIKLTLENEKLQKKLVELQREVSTVGTRKERDALIIRRMFS